MTARRNQDQKGPKTTSRLSISEYLVQPFALTYPPLELGRDPAKLSEVVRQHLARALVHGPLPKAVRLVQLVVVSPRETLGLPFPVLLRDGPHESKDLLGHYAAAVNYNRINPSSFHKRLASDPKSTYPAMLLVSFHENEERKRHTPAHALFASLRFPSGSHSQLDVPPEVAHSVQELPGEKCFMADMHAVLELPELKPLFHPRRSRADWNGDFSGPKGRDVADLSLDQARKAFRNVVEDLHRDERYLGAILPCINEGPVLLIDACPIISIRNSVPQRSDAECGYAGLTLLFEKTYKPTASDLDACFIVAQQVSLLWGQLGYLAARHRDDAVHDAYAVVRHSLGNAITWAPSDPKDIRRMLRLEEITLSSVPLISRVDTTPSTDHVAWGSGGPDGENLDESLRRGCFREHRNDIALDTELLHRHKVDPRLAVLLIELARNLGKHFRPPGGALKVRPAARIGYVCIDIVSYCDYRLLRDLRRTFQRILNSNQERRGLYHVWLLAQNLSDGDASFEYILGDEQCNLAEVEAPVTIGNRLTLRLKGCPSDLTNLGSAQLAANTDVVVPLKLAINNIHAFDPSL